MFFENGHSLNLIGSLVCNTPPAAIAQVYGSSAHPDLQGAVSFHSIAGGVLVSAAFRGLPAETAPCEKPIFALHIHEGARCTGTAADPFADAKTHYNPSGCSHPSHAGDLPPLFGCGGAAWMAVFTDRFTVSEVLGRTVILHAGPDDFTTQPAGNAGAKIACGVIMPWNTTKKTD